MTDSQRETIAFLSRGASYGTPHLEVERVETHWSIVFLVADRAYKLKRALSWSLLDYATVERREQACRAELRLNRRTAPRLYLEIRAIRRGADGALRFDGEGEALDWVVVMRRFDQAALLDRLADANRLEADTVRRLAAEIAAFHRAAEPTPDQGGAAGIATAIERWRWESAEAVSVLGERASADYAAAAERALAPAAALLERRRERGRVRRCHGDLRLANICLIEGRPTLFDAVEFSDRLSCIDVYYDLAFLLMDLDQRGHGDFAGSVVERYADLGGDREGLSLLPLFLSLRYAQRAQMLAASSLRQERAETARHHAAAARAHLDRAALILRHAPLWLPAGACPVEG